MKTYRLVLGTIVCFLGAAHTGLGDGPTNSVPVLKEELKFRESPLASDASSTRTNQLLQVKPAVQIGGLWAGWFRQTKPEDGDKAKPPVSPRLRASDRQRNLLYYPRSERVQGVVLFSLQF